MIQDSTNNEFFTETLNIYTSMDGNTFTYSLLLKACANLGFIIHGTMIHGHIVRLGFQDDLFVQTALVDMYAKCTYVECARHMFDEMTQRSVVSWNAMKVKQINRTHPIFFCTCPYSNYSISFCKPNTWSLSD
ncbi:hypothetical protein HN51_050620 [Arachis hypogaea]